ncbi:hypothetical protein BN136_2191 [Cronobacter universalis NCTC 9529]|nr:hypothetical protein BN136_2191 [Cronobacter universalis NCTC 9529]
MLITTTKQNDNHVAVLFEINPVSRAVVNTQLADACADGLNITRQTISQPKKPRGNHRFYPLVFQTGLPTAEYFSLKNMLHNAPCILKTTCEFYKSAQGE